jgi:hypothetical protein
MKTTIISHICPKGNNYAIDHIYLNWDYFHNCKVLTPIHYWNDMEFELCIYLFCLIAMHGILIVGLNCGNTWNFSIGFI